MASSSQYGSDDLHGAATRFEDRYSYLLEQLATEVEDAGLSLRGSAQAYEDMDLSASDRFTAHAGLG